MAKKDFEIPERLMKMEALRRRLLETHPIFPKIDGEYRRRLAGYRGEKSLLYYFSFLDDKKYRVLHNLRLPDSRSDHFFEIDTLIISSRLLIPIDAKNHRGELYFDELFDQLIQSYEDMKKSYDSPLAQINRHQFQLRQLLQTYKFPQIPITPLLVITNSSAIVSASQNHRQAHKITKSPNLLNKFNQLEKQYKQEVLDSKQLQKLTRLLLKLHTPYDKNILEELGINEGELLKGVQCSKCGVLPMKRNQKKWVCISCGFSSKSAHHSAINDYKLLIGNTITNQKLRDFLQLTSRSAATRILQSYCLSYTGEKKGRVYFV